MSQKLTVITLLFNSAQISTRSCLHPAIMQKQDAVQNISLQLPPSKVHHPQQIITVDFYTKFSSSALQTVRPNSQCSFLTLTGLAFLEHASYSLQGNTAKNSKAAHTTSLSDTKSSFPVLITAYYFASPPSLYLCKQLHN